MAGMEISQEIAPQVGGAPQIESGSARQVNPDAFGAGEAQERQTASNEDLTKTALSGIALQKSNMDQMVMGQADLDLKTAATAAAGKVMLTMKGQQADGAVDAGKKLFEEQVASIYKNMKNPQQQEDFQKYANNSAASLIDNLTNFRTQQLSEWDTKTTVARTKGYADMGIMSGGNSKAIADNTDHINAIWQDYGTRNGLSPEDIRQHQLDDLSMMHGGVVGNYLAAGAYKPAQAYFDEHKADISPSRLPGLQNELRQGAISDESATIMGKFNSVYRLPNGGLNIDKIDKDITNLKGYTPEEKFQLTDRVKGLARGFMMAKAQQKQDETESFVNWAMKARSDGESPDQIMLEVPKHADASQPYEYSQKLKMAQEIVGPAKQSDPDTYLYFKNELAHGTVDPAELDKAYYQDDKLSVKDYIAFGGDNIKNLKNGTDPKDKWADQAVNQMVKTKFDGDPQGAADFHRALDGENLTGQAKQDWAAKALGINVADTNKYKDWNIDWKADLQKQNETQSQWKQLNSTLGPDMVSAINQGFKAIKGASYNPKPDDLVNFVNSFGGPENVAPGTPVYKAIQYAVDHHHAPTVELIGSFLNKYPEGPPQWSEQK